MMELGTTILYLVTSGIGTARLMERICDTPSYKANTAAAVSRDQQHWRDLTKGLAYIINFIMLVFFKVCIDSFPFWIFCVQSGWNASLIIF